MANQRWNNRPCPQTGQWRTAARRSSTYAGRDMGSIMPARTADHAVAGRQAAIHPPGGGRRACTA